jgi:hypothetical protein
MTNEQQNRDAFNDAAREGEPVQLEGDTEFEDVVPVVPVNALVPNSGRYVRINEPLKERIFDPAAYRGVTALRRIVDVRFTDPSGEPIKKLPPSIKGCHIHFTVRGMPRGDVYRVEVGPDLDVGSGPAVEISQERAGTHVEKVQHFTVPLPERSARKNFCIEIFHVDKQTAQRDWCEDGKREADWRDYLPVESLAPAT